MDNENQESDKDYRDITVEQYFALPLDERKKAFMFLAEKFEPADEKTLALYERMRKAGVACVFPDGGMTMEQAVEVLESPEVQKLIKEI